MNIVIDLLMNGSLKVEYFDPDVRNIPRGIGLVQIDSADPQKVVFDVIWSLYGGNYKNFSTNPITTELLAFTQGTVQNGHIIMATSKANILASMADALL